MVLLMRVEMVLGASVEKGYCPPEKGKPTPVGAGWKYSIPYRSKNFYNWLPAS